MRLKTACGCMSLSTGSIILASLSVISSISSMIIMGTMMSQIETNNVSHDTLMIIECVFAALMVYFPIIGVSAILMIFGSVRRRPEYMFPWLSLAFAGVVSSICSYVATLVCIGFLLPIGIFLAIIALLTIVAALQIYFWLIVYSLYKNLLDEKYGYQVDSMLKPLTI